MEYINIISINSNIRFGKPCITGTRISVYDVLGWLASGMTIEEIVSDFPQLSREQILACLAYSADKERKARVAI
ncbi:MAG TPA: DUF433 domain-containing protein [Ignavibacteria bacterium]|nr:DUF433 domain-containing protein [Ignavibacteria bacterium]